MLDFIVRKFVAEVAAEVGLLTGGRAALRARLALALPPLVAWRPWTFMKIESRGQEQVDVGCCPPYCPFTKILSGDKHGFAE